MISFGSQLGLVLSCRKRNLKSLQIMKAIKISTMFFMSSCFHPGRPDTTAEARSIDTSATGIVVATLESSQPGLIDGRFASLAGMVFRD